LSILHFLGGPAVGDIRSRCLRLSSESCAEALAVKRLLGHRLSLEDSVAKSEW
jgi:cathepsin L